jgi:ribosomal protein S18 acetylase RimI-like enzyme
LARGSTGYGRNPSSPKPLTDPNSDGPRTCDTTPRFSSSTSSLEGTGNERESDPLDQCGDLNVAEAFHVRPARDEDRLPMAVVFAAVAEERDGIATEPPVDVESRAARWTLDGTFVADASGEIVGSLHVDPSRHGFGEVGMAVTREWRGRAVGSTLMVAGIEWARQRGLHKLSLSVWPHNAAAIALYRKYGFVEEGRRVKQYRRANGELWDTVDMGLLL